MALDDNEDSGFSLSRVNTMILKPFVEPIQPQAPLLPRMPKRTRLERLPLGKTTSAVIRAIRGMRAERLSDYFEHTCDRLQRKTAVVCGSTQLTYQELDNRANRLAHILISRGVGKGDAVGILLERSLDSYIALLGILKAGAVFVPIDPSFSSDLVAFIAEDAELQDLVTISAFREKTSAISCPVLELDQAYQALSAQHETRPKVRVDPVSLCYIIYTLGTAGQPKGAAVSHADIVNFLRVVSQIYRVVPNDRVYQGMPTTFDFSLGEIWSAWIVGATLVVGHPNSQSLRHGLSEFLIKQEITVLWCVPALLATIEIDVPSLRILLVVGEAFPADLISRWLRKGRRVLKTYGPTEMMSMATWCELFPGRSITIGSSLPACQIYVLDARSRLVKDGERGEICIGGRGYINCSDLVTDRFIPNPVWGDREIVPLLYRTGDIGCLTPSGEVAYLGRINDHMKIGAFHTIEQVALSEAKTASLVALPQTYITSLNEYASVPPFESRAISELEVETLKLRALNQINFVYIYRHIMTDPLYKNSLFNMASTFILGGLGFVFWIIIARLYKTEYVGIATTLMSVMTLLSGFTIMGLNSSLTRYLPKSASKNELINSSFAIVTIATLVVSVIFLLGLQIFSPQLLFLRSNIFYVISFTIFVIFCSWNILVDSIFMAFRSAANILIKNSIISTLKLALPFALIAFSAYGIFASSASAFTFGVLASLIILLLKFKIRPSLSVNASLVRETLVYSFANYIVDFMIFMPALILPVIVLNVLSAKYAAYYYVASMIQNVLLVVPQATSQALLAEGSHNEAELKKHVKKAITTTLAILIPITAAIFFAGKILLQFFGKNYAIEAFPFLQLYSLSTIFTALLMVGNAVLNVKHKVKPLVISNVMASVLTLYLSYVFISGKLVGIGWGWILGQAMAGGVSLYFIIHNCSDPPPSRASPGKVQGVFEKVLSKRAF